MVEMWLADAEPRGLDACLAPVACAELPKHGGYVVIDSLLGDDKALGRSPRCGVPPVGGRALRAPVG